MLSFTFITFKPVPYNKLLIRVCELILAEILYMRKFNIKEHVYTMMLNKYHLLLYMSNQCKENNIATLND